MERVAQDGTVQPLVPAVGLGRCSARPHDVVSGALAVLASPGAQALVPDAAAEVAIEAVDGPVPDPAVSA